MDKIEIQSTAKTPYVLLDPNGLVKFRGRSIPEDVNVFYGNILAWIIDYVTNAKRQTIVVVEMEYLNSGSSKFLLRILMELKRIRESGFALKIKWIYEEGDDDIMERGEYYASILDIDFEFEELE